MVSIDSEGRPFLDYPHGICVAITSPRVMDVNDLGTLVTCTKVVVLIAASFITARAIGNVCERHAGNRMIAVIGSGTESTRAR